MLHLRADARAEWLLLLPVLGVMATVFASIGEVRYRVPFDGFLIVLAARGYLALVPGMRMRLNGDASALSM
jgi:hypothetical protein